jgi:acetyl-CoA carboxylase biotin carboxylase subunit
MGAIVIEGIKKIGYEGAGTIEFLVDDRKNFYFMEMNTRVQVEHPITEEITKFGIIKEQIKIASGNRLSIKQSDVKFNGHSIECRINAEDPDNDFSPFPGEIKSLHFPAGFGVRVDSHLYAGYTVPQYYDSLLAKLIVWGEDRKEAISRMKRSLDETVIEGIKTTIPFHLKVMKHPRFIAGNVHTQFLKELGY